MGKIIRFDTSRKKPHGSDPKKIRGCDHKQVTAYTYYRTVRCSFCGMELDPFDVLVDMLKNYVPPDEGELEVKRLLREVERRDREKQPPAEEHGGE